MTVLDYLVPVAIGAVFIVLLMGLWNMMRGGSPNRSQTLMRWRVILQFVAVVVIMGAISRARKRILIMTPYFLPNRQMLGCLQAAALSGAPAPTGQMEGKVARIILDGDLVAVHRTPDVRRPLRQGRTNEQHPGPEDSAHPRRTQTSPA